MNQMDPYNFRLNKKQTSLLLRLYSKQPWLSNRHTAVDELLEICSSIEEQELICELFERFTYIKLAYFDDFLQKVSKTIADDWKPSIDKSIVAATAVDPEPDSAQIIIYYLRQVLSRNGWTLPRSRYVSTLPKAYKAIGTIPDPEDITIIFVDEFVGTGQTMSNRIKVTRNELERNRGITNYQIKVCVLASMEEGIQEIEKNGVDCYVYVVLKKGISGYYDGGERTEAHTRMKSLESLLQQDINGLPLPSLGYDQAEALYARQVSETEIANTPNSVFPIFWWPYYADNSKRNTVLDRVL